MLRKIWLWVAASTSVFSLAPSLAIAQTTNAAIVGTVADPSGAAVSGATVTVTNSATGVSRDVKTSGTGEYRVFPLAPGTYRVAASMAGFKTKVQPEVVLEVAASMKVDLTLEVGEVRETVEVSGAPPILQTQETSVGTTVTRSELARLPVNGRNYTRLILLVPGTSDRTKNQKQGAFSGTDTYSVNGQRGQDNNYTIDGVDNNFLMMNSPGGSPPMDSIQEFRVMTGTSAEFGRSAGANVNMAIKSGSRDFHGSAYEYLRNDKLDANEFFANRSGTGKVPFRQNQYGISLGGPVYIPKLLKDREKTFWFINWEGFRSRRGSTSISTVPVQAQREGDFSQQPRTIYDPLTSTQGANNTVLRQPFAANSIPQSRINPAMKLFIDTMLPQPNRSGLASNYINTQPSSNDRDMYVIRGDRILSQKDTLMVRFFNQKVGQLTPGANPSIYTESRYDARNLAAGWNHIFGPSAVLEAKFGFNFPSIPTCAHNTRMTRGEFLDKSGLQMFQRDVFCDALPTFAASGEFSLGGSGSTQQDHVYQAMSAFSKMTGPHSFKVGINYTRRQLFTNSSNPIDGNVTFDRTLTQLATNPNSGHSTASFLLGYPSQVTRAMGDFTTQGRQNVVQLFAQDDWRITHKLTLNLGIRYEYFPPAYDITDRLGNLWIRTDPATGKAAGTLLWATVNPEIDPDTGRANEPAKREGFGRALQASDHNNFAPRVGIAYQIDSKTVIRTAFGVFYDTTFMQELQDKRKFWPYSTQQRFVANTGLVPDLSISDPGPSYGNTSAIGGWPQDPLNRTPYSMQWNLAVQRELARDLTLDFGYVGSGNHKLAGYTPLNSAVTPGPGAVQPRRLLPNFGDMWGGENYFNSNYNSLQIKTIKRFSQGFQFNANYTWSRSMDGQSSLAFGPDGKTQNPFDRRPDYSRSSWDLRHVFQIAYVFELPFGKGRKLGGNWNRAVDGILGGWSFEGITRYQTGAPVNVTISEDRANIGSTKQRPNALHNPNTGPKTPEEWFDISAFALQKAYTFGNAGVNVVDSDGRHNWDLAIQKTFHWKDRHQVHCRAEFFNLPNAVSMADPNSNFSSSSFGQVLSATTARQIQFGLRYSF